jgi:hypothetical protein
MKNRILSIMDTRSKRAGFVVIVAVLSVTVFAGATFAMNGNAPGNVSEAAGRPAAMDSDVMEAAAGEDHIIEMEAEPQYPVSDQFHLLRDVGQEVAITETFDPDGFVLSMEDKVYRIGVSATAGHFAVNQGSVENIAMYNGDILLLSNPDGKGWDLATDRTMSIAVDIDLSAAYSDKENGELMEVGYYHNGAFNRVYFGKVKPDAGFSFAAPESGEYYWYILNACAGIENLTSVSVSLGQ